MNSGLIQEQRRLDARLQIAAVLTLGFLLLVAVASYLTWRFITVQLPALTELESLHTELQILTETLPIEAQMAVLTGDAERAAQFQRDLARFKSLQARLRTPETAAILDLHPEGAGLNLHAVDLSKREAAQLTQAGRHAAAREALRAAHAAGVSERNRWKQELQRLHADVVAKRDALRSRVFVVTAASALLGLFTVPAWALTARATRRLQRKLLREYETLSRGAERLRASLNAMDDQVAERTRMLKESESALLNMMEDAVHSRDRAERALEDWKAEVAGRTRLEEQFRQAQKMEAIGRLSGGIAHDFNNLLTVILGHARVLELEELPTDAGLAAGEIKRAGERAAALTRQLLLFARKQPMQMKRLDLNEAVVGVTRMLERILGEDIALVFSPWRRPLPVDADESMLDQVLMNLAVNARDAMPGGGKLLIETAEAEFSNAEKPHLQPVKPGRFVCLAVSDTGSGIPREILPKIFDPFFTTKDVGKGTGLGLATVFGIVEQHGGWIHAYSEEGRGSIFRVYLPSRHAGSEASVVSVQRSAAPPGSETILLVEDEDSIRKMLVRYLERLGYEALAASDGAAALEIYRQRKADIRLVMTDIVMPGGMSGVELAAHIAAEGADLPIIFTSGYSEMSAAGSAPLKEGANFLAKPYDLPQVAELLRKRLDGAGQA